MCPLFKAVQDKFIFLHSYIKFYKFMKYIYQKETINMSMEKGSFVIL